MKKSFNKDFLIGVFVATMIFLSLSATGNINDRGK